MEISWLYIHPSLRLSTALSRLAADKKYARRKVGQATRGFEAEQKASSDWLNSSQYSGGGEYLPTKYPKAGSSGVEMSQGVTGQRRLPRNITGFNNESHTSRTQRQMENHV